MQNIKIGALVILVAASLVGCAKPGIEGKWTTSNPPGLPAGTTASATSEFKGGALTSTMDVSVMGMSMKISGKGTYTLEGDKLTTTMTEAKLDESSLPAAAKPMAPQIQKGIDTGVNKPNAGTIKIDGDTMTFTATNGVTTYTRAK